MWASCSHPVAGGIKMRDFYIYENGRLYQYSQVYKKYVCIGDITKLNREEVRAWQEARQKNKKDS